MLTLNPYLNFPGTTEAAFEFYRSVFGGELTHLMRFGDMGQAPGAEPLTEEQRNGVMHVRLAVGNSTLMATDSMASMGMETTAGTNMTLALHPDTREEADRLYAALSEGGEQSTPMQDVSWGDYWGSLVDQFGMRWMINVASNPAAS